VGNGGGGDMQLRRGPDEALVPGSGIKKAKTLKRR
jgi:hypothetical protein